MVALAGRGWRLAPCLVSMIAEVDTIAPGRSRKADGSIGDAAHQSRTSHHNPWRGYVDALDVTHDPGGGWDCHERIPALLGDPRVEYVIFARRIWRGYPRRSLAAWEPSPYTGSNPHTHHMHVSVWRDVRRDNTRPWWDAPTTEDDDMGDHAQLIRLAYAEAGLADDHRGQSYWTRLLRTKAEGPDWVVDQCRRQLGLDPIPG